MKVINIGIDRIALYGKDSLLNKIPVEAVPIGWPEVRTFCTLNPMYELSEEEVYEKFRVKFPISPDELINTHTEGEISRLVNYCSQLATEHHLVSEGTEVVKNTVEYFVENNIHFYYPVKCLANLWYFEEKPKLRENVAAAVKKGLCTVLFSYVLEGDINEEFRVQWLVDFGKLNNLNKRSFVLMHGNLRLQELLAQMENRGIEINFSYVSTIAFESHPLFIASPSERYQRDEVIRNAKTFPLDNTKKNSKYHFNVLNRRPHRHRVILFTEIKSNPELERTTHISLGYFGNLRNKYVIEWIREAVDQNPKFKPNLEFALKHDFEKPTLLDVEFEFNHALRYNRQHYTESFCSVITETTCNPGNIFFSEKIFKPIYNLHPFLLLGNPHSLQKLKSLGYRTFDKWWDESYDLEENYLFRIKAISKVMLEISKWSLEKCNEVTIEMEEVLNHNFSTFIYNTRHREFCEEIYNKQFN